LAGRIPALVLWLGLPLAIHDAVVVPATLALAYGVRRMLPVAVWGPIVVGLVVSAVLVLLALADGLTPATGTVPGLLQGDYRMGLGVALAVTWLTILVMALLTSRIVSQVMAPVTAWVRRGSEDP
jgi:hypothetical protein